MNEGEVGHHHAKRLGLVHPAENLPAHSLQLVGNIVVNGNTNEVSIL